MKILYPLSRIMSGMTIILLLACTKTFSQDTFQKSIGGAGNDFGMTSIEVSGGGYAIAGTRVDKFFLVRLDANYDTLWTKTYSAAGMLFGTYMAEAADGGFVLVGDGIATSGAGMDDIILIKTDANGEVEWSKVYGTAATDYGAAIAVADDGYYIAGAVNISINANDAIIIKTNLEGNLEWSRTFGGIADENINALYVLPGGGCLALGTTTSFTKGSNAAFLTQWEADSELEMSGIYYNGGNTYGFGISTGQENGWIISGVTDGAGAGSYDAMLLKLDDDFEVSWSKAYGGSDWENAVITTALTNGGYATIGQTYSFGVNSDIQLIRTNDSGEINWCRTYGGAGYEFGLGLVVAPDGFLLSGGEESFGSDRAMYMIKTDNNGVSNCNDAAFTPAVADGAILFSEIEITVNGTITSSSTQVQESGGATMTTHCEVVEVGETFSPEINSFPNPFISFLTVNGTSLNAMMTLHAITGQVVLESRCKNASTTLDTSLLSPGIYILNYREGETVKNIKVVKQ